MFDPLMDTTSLLLKALPLKNPMPKTQALLRAKMRYLLPSLQLLMSRDLVNVDVWLKVTTWMSSSTTDLVDLSA
jgi:hypothetical protein